VVGELRKRITAADVQTFAALLGDNNPVHLDAAYAARTRFKRPISHGMIPASMISTIFGAMVPGAI
jgi:acyl dehydratase